MKIGLVDVDSHRFPNLCLMKLSAFHKNRGDTVEWADRLTHYDRIYFSRVFDDTYTKDDTINGIWNADELVRGGTGYSLNGELPYEIEHIMPDYELYRERYPKYADTAIGFLTRGCPRHCDFCIVGDKEGLRSHKVADVDEFWSGQPNIELLDPNILACPDRHELFEQLIATKARVNINQGLDIRLMTMDAAQQLKRMKTKRIHFAWDNPDDDLEGKFKAYADFRGCSPNSHGGPGTVYVLVNHGSSMEGNLHRIYTLRDMGFAPYVMVFDKPNAPQEIKDLQRWCNNPFVFYKTPRFEDYVPVRAQK